MLYYKSYFVNFTIKKMNINAISPLDGRYAKKVENLSAYFSEKALMHARCVIECWYIIALDKYDIFPKLTELAKDQIERVINDFTDDGYIAIKEIEATTNHDVKACEIYLQETLNLPDNNIIHFGLTSEDVNNLAHTYLLKKYVEEEQLSKIEELIKKLIELVDAWKTVPFPSRTHGQKATPSTAGKELAVFLNRIIRIYDELKAFRFSGKLNGAVGNYSAMMAAVPAVDWHEFAARFFENHDLEHNIATTQIEDHDTWAKYFNLNRQLNNILIDLNVDCWLYISKELFSEKVKEGEVGSSTMPHKVNPINFENSEGNLLLSNSILGMMSDKLCRSRMQRDLSDSTVERNFGVALGHAYLGYIETLRGLNKLQVNKNKCIEELENSPELLAEPIQTILRLAKVENPYNLLKKATRGQKIDRKTLMNLVKGLDIPEKLKERIHKMTVVEYVGDAKRIAEMVIEKAKKSVES